MFNHLITFLTQFLATERELEGYNQVVLAWSGQQGKVDSKGHARVTSRRSAIAYILMSPVLKGELAIAYRDVFGKAADFQGTCDEFYTSSKDDDGNPLTGKALATARKIQTDATARLEQAFRGIDLEPSTGWSFVPSRSGRLMAAYPSTGTSDTTDEFLRVVNSKLTV